MKTRAEYISEIRQISGELAKLNVPPEEFDFSALNNFEIKEIWESISDQLETRKRFLDRADTGRKLIK